MKSTVKQLREAGFSVLPAGAGLAEITRATPFAYCRASISFDPAAVVESAIDECGFDGINQMVYPMPAGDDVPTGLYFMEYDQISELISINTMILRQREALVLLQEVVNYPKEQEEVLKLSKLWPIHPAKNMAAQNAAAIELVQSSIGYGLMKQCEMIAEWIKA